MPWVRLHATKDYLGMALHLEEVPEFSCTINLVPSLLAQIQAYVNGASDAHLASSRRPVDGLEGDDACYVLDNFFMANPDSMIRPHPRYHELFLMRSSWDSSAKQALHRFRPRDLRDLQVWSNLAWVHPLLFEKDLELAEFKNKGRYYTEGKTSSGSWTNKRELVARVDTAPLRAGREGPDRADHDALLSSDSAVAPRQDAGAGIHAGSGLAGLSWRLP